MSHSPATLASAAKADVLSIMAAAVAARSILRRLFMEVPWW
jgi:hypothetical protein